MTASVRKRERGRAVLLWAAGLFVGVQLLASGLFDYCWPQVRFPRLHQQLARFDPVAGNVNVLFLGSSRTEALIDEYSFDQVAREVAGDSHITAFNASIPAGDPVLCERTLQALLNHGAHPRYVVIEVCPEGVTEPTAWLAAYVGWTLCWDDAPAYLKDLTVTGNLLRFAGTRVIPLYVYREQIRRQLGKQVVAWWGRRMLTPAFAATPPTAVQPVAHAIEQGAIAEPEAPAARWSRAIAGELARPPIDPTRTTLVGLDAIHRQMRDYRPGGNAAAALERTLKRCRSHGIEPIILSVPVSSGHRQCYDAQIEAAFQAYIGALARRYGCRYIDHRSALPDAFFVDHHHVGREGGRVYSQQIALEVIGPLWK